MLRDVGFWGRALGVSDVGSPRYRSLFEGLYTL